MKDSQTKERILDAAEAIMLEKSFHSVGLNEILAAVQVPKGSFYHYFKSKEEFGVEMLKHYVAAATAHRKQALLSPSSEANPLKRLLAYLEGGLAKCHASNGRCPCLVIKLASEVANFSEPMRQVLAEGSREWIGILEEVLREGIAKKKISKRVDPAAMAVVIQDLFTGAIQRAATQRNTVPLRHAIDYIKTVLAPA